MQEKELNIEDLISLVAGFIAKNLILLIVLFLLGTIIGFMKFKKAKNEYVTNVYAVSDIMPLDIISNEILSIQQLMEENSLTELTSKLNIEDSIITRVNKIGFNRISSDENMFKLEFSCAANPIYNQIAIEKLYESLNSNAFITAYLEEKKYEIENNILINELELENLIDIQKNILDSKKSKSNISIVADPSFISSQILILKKDILLNKTMLDKVGIYNIIDEVTVVKKPSLKMSLFKWIIMIIFLGMVSKIIFSLFIKR